MARLNDSAATMAMAWMPTTIPKIGMRWFSVKNATA
jgi:hypothetical protein